MRAIAFMAFGALAYGDTNGTNGTGSNGGIKTLPTWALPAGCAIMGGATLVVFAAVYCNWRRNAVLDVTGSLSVPWLAENSPRSTGSSPEHSPRCSSTGSALELQQPQWAEESQRQCSFTALLVLSSVLGTWSVVLVGTSSGAPLIGRAVNGYTEHGSWDLVVEGESRQCSVAMAPRDFAEARSVTVCKTLPGTQRHMCSR
jgi:hypothetical protein